MFAFQRGNKLSGVSTFKLFDHVEFIFILTLEAEAAPDPDV